MTRQPLSISVDFNRLDDDDVVWAPRDSAPDAHEGQPVILHDADGNRCLGIVERVEDRRVYISAMLSTWQDAEPVEVSFEGGSEIGVPRWTRSKEGRYKVTDNKTINPAGMPVIKPIGGDKPYTREDFVRDLQKVSKKTEKPASGKA